MYLESIDSFPVYLHPTAQEQISGMTDGAVHIYEFSEGFPLTRSDRDQSAKPDRKVVEAVIGGEMTYRAVVDKGLSRRRFNAVCQAAVHEAVYTLGK